jgi:hypothetical protein
MQHKTESNCQMSSPKQYPNLQYLSETIIAFKDRAIIFLMLHTGMIIEKLLWIQLYDESFA